MLWRGILELGGERKGLGVCSQASHAETTTWARTFPKGQKEGNEEMSPSTGQGPSQCTPWTGTIGFFSGFMNVQIFGFCLKSTESETLGVWYRQKGRGGSQKRRIRGRRSGGKASNIYSVGVGWKTPSLCSGSLQIQVPCFPLCGCQVFRKPDNYTSFYYRIVCFSKCPLVGSTVDKCNYPHFTGE